MLNNYWIIVDEWGDAESGIEFESYEDALEYEEQMAGWRDTRRWVARHYVDSEYKEERRFNE